MKSLCFWLLVSCLTFESALCLRCYATNIQLALMDKYTNEERECTDQSHVCYKAVTNEDSEYPLKGCIPAGGCEAIESEAWKKNPEVGFACHECYEDLCNAKSKIEAFGLFGLVIVVLALVL